MSLAKITFEQRQQLIAARKKRLLSQEKLAALLGMSTHAYRNIENGRDMREATHAKIISFIES